jgi:hypothetical protein
MADLDEQEHRYLELRFQRKKEQVIIMDPL